LDGICGAADLGEASVEEFGIDDVSQLPETAGCHVWRRGWCTKYEKKKDVTRGTQATTAGVQVSRDTGRQQVERTVPEAWRY
jgi:hypothetical protein